jgi:predicted enzyme related to lactoylglutathione lyase
MDSSQQGFVMGLDYIGELTCSMGVTDLGRSIGWYEEVLGFTLLYRADDIAWCEMSTGVAKVNVGLSQIEAAQQGGGCTPVWGVVDLDLAKTHLDQHKVRQDGPIRHIPGLVKLLTFFDPDGNCMMLFQTDPA